ncbi:TetR/AcrR family transcriptional regulator [Lactobacillus sp. UCMA15818]|uniref:TetR/AcrR family transcriptional regulator n=1 Tax=Lactobacillus sp. UCMA15818 TaxID=2583394 RepID=UPI0025AF1D58|nr:TetR/AcrR family transcriptional regulator [Lactobacillus sp. UCMA15818]MDN2452158.1 TetR/AcrR family transcriptional regulator [Lactobacillus sp. UCMA15818]
MGNVRRRGIELESAIYKVVREVVDEEGIEGVTFQKIAKLAGTSKSVIYRRWETPFELAISAFQDRIQLENKGSVDKVALTGKNMHDDLLQLMNRFLISIDTLGKTFLRSLLIGIGDQPNEAMQRLMDKNSEIDLRAINRILERARSRGEDVREDIPDDVKLLPFEWLRYKMFLQNNISRDMIEMLIEDILIPVYLKG